VKPERVHSFVSADLSLLVGYIEYILLRSLRIFDRDTVRKVLLCMTNRSLEYTTHWLDDYLTVNGLPRNSLGDIIFKSAQTNKIYFNHVTSSFLCKSTRYQYVH